MIRDITKILMEELKDLPFVDKIGGLAELTKEDSRQMVVCSEFICEGKENESYLEFVPEDKYKSMFYFEGNAPVRLKEKRVGGINVFETQVLLIGWLNLKKLGYKDAMITSVVMNSIIKKLITDKISTVLPFSAIKIKAVQENIKDQKIFSKNGYNDVMRFYPYDYFSLSINLDVYVNFGCLEDYIEKQEKKC